MWYSHMCCCSCVLLCMCVGESTQVLTLRSHSPISLFNQTLLLISRAAHIIHPNHTHLPVFPSLHPHEPTAPLRAQNKKSLPEAIDHRELNFSIPSQLFKSSFEGFPPRLLLVVCTLGGVWGQSHICYQCPCLQSFPCPCL